ncbi:hypothetical protein [Candidatus Alkanophaga liquidiphilum]|nr:hypothetical protein [Candidatus Alkanophaga liquidiphilum]
MTIFAGREGGMLVLDVEKSLIFEKRGGDLRALCVGFGAEANFDTLGLWRVLRRCDIDAFK